MILVIAEFHLALESADPPAHGNAGFVHRFAGAGDERVPPGEPAALGETAIGAGMRQPAVILGALRRDLEAIGHARLAVLVVLAAAARPVEQPAGDVGVVNPPRVFILELHQTTAAAAVAERFPFGTRHRGERFGLPKIDPMLHRRFLELRFPPQLVLQL